MSQTYTIGLLSGTSVDAIDGILLKWEDNRPITLCTHSHDIPQEIRETVFNLAVSGQNEIEQIRNLDYEFALLFSQTAAELCQQSGIDASEILAIGCHGQTIRHYPPSQVAGKQVPGFSLQIGDPNIIAERTRITTVADFRRRDIAAGGHGAPLAPAIHRELFQSADTDRIIINTGGIANITYLPAQGEAIGFDTGPANGLMDSWCQLHTGQSYDKDGNWAKKGRTQPDILEKLLAHPYFSLPPPKSTGREDFNLPWLEQQLSKLSKQYSPEDVQASLLSFSTESIAIALEPITDIGKCEVYVCGGGAHNRAFATQLEEKLQPRFFGSTDTLGISPDWVEAVCFAWLAKKTMAGDTSNLPSVTGAGRKVILGGIYLA